MCVLYKERLIIWVFCRISLLSLKVQALLKLVDGQCDLYVANVPHQSSLRLCIFI